MFSQGCVGWEGMTEHRQASPIETPSICVRVDGQMGDRPSIKTDHSVEMGIIGTEEAWVEGCESR